MTDPMSNRFPPDGFMAAQSAVPGIDVYKPAPEETSPQRAIVAFDCPQCNATTGYSTKDGGLTCSYCGYHEPPARPIVGRGAEEFEFTVTTVQQAAHGWGVERKELQCQRCGALTIIPPDTLSHTCPFCGSNNVIQHKAPQDKLRPRFLIPFKIQERVCHKIARQWLSSNWMTPGSLNRLARIAEFTPIFLPFWTFDATMSADWRAEVGHTKTTRHYNASRKRWESRTKTVWRWESGHLHQVVDDLLVPGTSKLSRLILSRIKEYDLHELVVYEPSYLAGLQAQAYDVNLATAWEEGRSRMREQARLACRAQASTSKIRNFSMSLDFSDESWRYILLPVYAAAYSYQSQSYQVMVNGQTGQIAGQRPVDWFKVWLAITAMLLPGLGIGFIGLLTLALGGVGFIIAIFGFMALVAGLFFALNLFRRAQEMDDV
jgi:DNA-directed RNA polymerase subunit RPC12/RpoP